MKNNAAINEAAGDDLAAILEIPLFLRRPYIVSEEKMIEEISEPMEMSQDLYGDAPAENTPSLEQILDMIRKMGTKIDSLTEARRALKKQAERMLKNL